jgi:photosystem II stability/assembly factor-like uncharacterized protein
MITDEGGSLLRTSDGGKTWTYVVPEGMDGDGKPVVAFPDGAWRIRTEYSSGVFDPVNADRIYVASNRGLLVTEDRGKTWSIANIGSGGLWPQLTL